MTILTNENKITATKDTLNYLSMIADEAAKSYKNRGRDALAKRATEFSDIIYNVLKENNFYD